MRCRRVYLISGAKYLQKLGQSWEFDGVAKARVHPIPQSSVDIEGG
jgi:glutamine synthetase adenylyltransferase